MGKKKNKKGDAEKKAALQAKKEAKQEKAALKRLTKEQRSGNDGTVDDDDDIIGGITASNDHDYLDQVLQSYKKQSGSSGASQLLSSETTTTTTTTNNNNSSIPTWEVIDTIFPLARANATFEYCVDDSKKKKSKGHDYFYLFGGEYFDGIENIVLDGLLRYDVTKKEWKVLVTPPNNNAGNRFSQGPNPRCAHSCVSYKEHLYIFGGEMSNSDVYYHFRDLWKFNVTTLEWTEIISPSGVGPSPRSGHVTIVWKHYMILFGGFYEALKTDTKWYNDIHIFNLQTETWMTSTSSTTSTSNSSSSTGMIPPMSRLSIKPEPRSACNVSIFGTDKMLIHGGFSKYKYSGPTTVTSTSGDLEVKVHSDAWVLHLTPILQQKSPTWERWISSTTKTQLVKEHQHHQHTIARTPNGRAGTSSISYKGNRMLVFGGVVDSEHHHHKVESIFYNDLMSLDMERRKWSSVRVNSTTTTTTTTTSKKTDTKNDGGQQQQQQQTPKDDDGENKKDENENENDDGSVTSSAGSEDDLLDEEDDDEDIITDPNKKDGWDLEDLRANMFAFVDADGNVVYEKIPEEGKGDKEEEKEEEEEEDEDEEKEEEKEEEEEDEEDDDNDEEKEEEKQDSRNTNINPKSNKTITSSSVMKVNTETNTYEAVVRTEPLPRINSCLLLRGHTLYLLGGILEVGDREVTLDDMWSLNLRKRDQWECLWPGTMHKQVWRGAIHDDDDSYISTGTGNKEDSDEEEDSDDDGDDSGDEKEGGIKAHKKKSSKSSRARQELAELHEKYDLGDELRAPKSTESLADFYSRTSIHWNGEAAKQVEGTGKELSTKELKREGFQLARERYDELRPIIDRLAELELQHKDTPSGSKTDRRESKSEKKEKKSKKSSKR